MSFKDLLKISPIVLQALKNHQPVVALESTIISHGMPYPNNKICALEVQDVIKKHGATPATVAIMDGYIHIGLTQETIEQFAKSGSKARKVSRRDLPYVIAQKQLGATTVAGTMICSALAGIDVFVTGGIGGVHRGFQETMDVSADLRQLGRTPVTVISAGVKNILDIPRTIQYLQTQGVPVITYGSKFFPAFFSPSSGIQSPLSMNNIDQIADVLAVRKALNLQNGILVAVPNQQTGDGKIIQDAINQALKQAHEEGIKGAASTPFLLKRVHTLTGGASIKSNITLIKRNAEVGSKLAVSLANKQNKKKPIIEQGNGLFSMYTSKASENTTFYFNKDGPKKNKLIVVGGSAVDFQVSVTDGKLQLYQSCKGVWRTSYGGVGRNIAEVSKRLGTETVFVTALGGDNTSNDLRKNILSHGIRLHQIKEQSYNAPTYLGVLDDNNDAIIGISDMDVNNGLTFDKIYENFFRQQQKKGINKQDIVVLDANIIDDNHNLLKLLQYLNQKGYFTLYECKGRKALKVVTDNVYEYISLLKMNEKERQLVVKTLRNNNVDITYQNQYDWFSKNIGSKNKNYDYTTVNSIITNGADDLKLIDRDGVKLFKAIRSNKVYKTNGAGDTLTGVLCSMLLRGQNIQTAVKYGIVASTMTIESQSRVSAICDYLSFQSLKKEYQNCRARQLI